jgi:low affinity Fe/Cu permease
MSEAFRKFAHVASRLTGSFSAFMLAFLIVVVWGLTGPIFGFSDTWQLVINTGTTIVTFLMVFLIQNTQNRDSQAIHAKLDELLYKSRETDNKLLKAEDLSDAELDELKAHYESLADHVAERSRSRPKSKSNGAKNGNASRTSASGRTTARR